MLLLHVLACAGEVVVFNINGRDIPIVHRVIKVHDRAEEDHIDILTKVSTLRCCCEPHAGSRGGGGSCQQDRQRGSWLCSAGQMAEVGLRGQLVLCANAETTTVQDLWLGTSLTC